MSLKTSALSALSVVNLSQMRVILNFALTADGKISTRAKSPAHFTSKRDLEQLHVIRQRADAILVGRGTLEADQMSLTTKGETQPWRCIISKSGNFDPSHKVFHSEGGPIHLIVTDGASPEIKNASIHQTSLTDWLKWMEAQDGIETLLCEGGGMLAKELFKLDVVDEINLTLATHTLFGGKDAPSLTGVPGDFLPESRFFTLKSCEEAAPSEYFLRYVKN